MADEPTKEQVAKALNPLTDGSGAWQLPGLSYGLNFKDYGSYGLRQYSGWVREEFLPQLQGRQAITVYREMLDNSSVVGSMMFAIQQSMRHVEWRVEAPGDANEKTKEVQFVEECMGDMSHTWSDFITEALSMLGYGFAPHEIVYKRRNGHRQDHFRRVGDRASSSNYSDGRIGWRRLPIRGQETILKWYFDENGQIRGLQQQPWVGNLLDIPIEKMLLFRPTAHKNNPEGRSILRNAYRSYYFVKRLEELEAILFERMSGFPIVRVPSQLMEVAAGSSEEASKALATLKMYQKMVTNVRVDEQMGAILPSDTYKDSDGKTSDVRMYEFEFVTPGSSGGGKGSVDVDKTITRHKVDMMMTTLCDFINMGHEIRGTNNLGTMKVDMFYAAIEGWISVISDVMNRYALPRLWSINGLPPDTMPNIKHDMPQRLDLDGLGGYIFNLAQSGMALFPDEELEGYLRDAAGLPEIDPDVERGAMSLQELQGQQALDQAKMSAAMKSPDGVKKMIRAAVAKQILKSRKGAHP